MALYSHISTRLLMVRYICVIELLVGFFHFCPMVVYKDNKQFTIESTMHLLSKHHALESHKTPCTWLSKHHALDSHKTNYIKISLPCSYCKQFKIPITILFIQQDNSIRKNISGACEPRFPLNPSGEWEPFSVRRRRPYSKRVSVGPALAIDRILGLQNVVIASS